VGRLDHEVTWPAVSVCYITHRLTPRFDWFAASLAHQLQDSDDIEVVVVDGMRSASRAECVAATVADRFPVRCVAAKPNPMNGPHRITTRDYLATGSARNTGIVHARHPYVVFVDDCSVVMPGWWEAVRRAARNGAVVGGAYQKHWDMDVREGRLITSRVERGGVDSRWDLGSEDGPVGIVGGQLYGCSFGAPRDLLLDVNGLDELCHPAGGEDYQLGLRLEWAGAEVLYDRSLLTIESEDLHRSSQVPARVDRSAEPAAYMEVLKGFGVDARTTDGDHTSSKMVLDILYGLRPTRSLGNYYDLALIDSTDPDWGIERFPKRYWFDGQPLAEM
jgi:hypothetical protein